MTERHLSRVLPVGAEIAPDGVHVRVWAPSRRRVAVVVEGRDPVPLEPEPDGYFAGLIRGGGAGWRYGFRVDDDERVYPDPASRFQPDGPHGLSEVIDPRAFAWTDGHWMGVLLPGQVLYELHVGTFTRDGTFAAAAAKLELLADVGVTVVELMPVAEFPGEFGWGYDGVDLYAPAHIYGRPDDLRRFVDRAHALGLGVILDVVYNHLGPDGNYLHAFSADYFTDRYTTEWGAAINYDGERSAPVRELFCANASYWIREFHMDGLRLDATQAIFDESPRHVLEEIHQRAHEAAGPRSIILVAENEPQETRLVRPSSAGGFGLDALWNDDLHHSLVVAATGQTEAYYTDYGGSPQEFIAAAKWGYLYQGQRYRWQEQRRGSPGLDLPPASFVTFLENHDQVANTARGDRLHQRCAPALYRALTALVLLMPGTPMLFQGQEWNSSRPFLYFADHNPDLAQLVRDGRAEFLEQFQSIRDPAVRAVLDDPSDRATFEACILDWTERDTNGPVVALHRDLLTLRRTHHAFRRQALRGVDGAVLAADAFVLRFFDGLPGDAPNDETRGDRLLIVNLGRQKDLPIVPEPLLAPPLASRWHLAWSSEAPDYGGGGTMPVELSDGRWGLPARAAVVMTTVAGAPARGAHKRRTA
jgi:maltooligosyltrehalose trehalohydrolase